MGKKRTFAVRRMLGTFAVVAALGGGFYAFTASNTFSAGTNAAGQGSGTVSGYTVGVPIYTLLASDPSKITSFQFSIAGGVTASTVVKASLVSGTWVACSVGSISAGAGTATCSYGAGSEPSVSVVSSLNVVAAN
jgi:hypothetical protein